MTAGSFNVSMLLTADAKQARGEITGVSGDLQALGQAAKTSGAATAAGMKQAEAQVLEFRRAANGATSNLVAQFNDVGQMLAAGQSPLLLAAQQGTQIAQALGPLGARGAVQALGGAFLGMLNPVNLAVFAVVAGLGLLGNALRGVFGEAKSVEDALGDLGTATKEWRDAASVGVDDLARQFGKVTPEIIGMQRELTELALAETLLKAADAARTFGESLNPAFYALSSRTGNIADLLGVDERVATDSRNPLTPQVDEFQRLLGTAATSGNTDEQIAALGRMREMVAGSTADYKDLTAEQLKFLDDAIQIERQLRLVQAAQEGIGSAQQIAADHAAKARAELQEEINLRQLTLRLGENSVEVALAREAAERSVYQAQLEAKGIAGETLADLMALWDAANGVDTGIKGWLASLLDASGASDETRRSVQDAWDAVTGAADATNVWAGTMASVAAQVRGIGSALAALGSAGIANASKQIEIDALKAGKSAAEARRVAVEDGIRKEGQLREAAAKSGIERVAIGLETEAKLRGVALDAELSELRDAANERDQAANRAATRGASAGRRQAEAADRLLESLRAENDLLQEMDPVQQEMIRHRQALAGASAAQRAQVEQLIAANIRLEEQQDREKQNWEEIKGVAYDALDALIIQGDKASDVMANLAQSIAKAFLQSALLGDGPLAGLFGGQGTGLFDIIGGAFGIPGVPAKADGGWITGPGGPRDDMVLSWLSNGEFVVNAASAARHRPLLEQINAAPRFASGGSVGGPAFSAVGGPGARAPLEILLTLSSDLDARINRTAEDVSVRVVKGGIEHYDAKVLPGRMSQIQSDPRRVG